MTPISESKRLTNTNYPSRYSRQILFNEIGENGQALLAKSKVAVLGVGALGTVISELLCRAGVGTLMLIDRDCVELSNLQRQVLFEEKDVGNVKAETAKQKLLNINSGINVEAFVVDITHKNISTIIGKPTIIIDCTDNLETRYLLNDYCKKYHIPWIYGGGISSIGNVFMIDNKKGRPCFSCIFPNAKAEGTCDTIGVINSLTTVIASIQANECIKFIVGAEYEKNLLRINVWNNSFDKIIVKQRKSCKVCRAHYEYLEGNKQQNIVKYCSSGQYQIYGEKKELKSLTKRLKKLGKVTSFLGCLHFKINNNNNNGTITLFKDGRCLINAKSIEEAKSAYAKYVGA